MKKLLFLAFLLLSVSIAADEVQEVVPAETCPATTVASGSVLCCCQTFSGGMCCQYVGYCGSFVPGCLCAIRAIEVQENE
jgi:hypothetical protein